MAIVMKTSKTGKRTVTSSYFDDIGMIRQSLSETDFRALRNEQSKFDLNKLSQAAVVEQFRLWHLGCAELNDYVARLKPEQMVGLTTKFFGEEWKPDQEPTDEQKKLAVQEA